MYRIAGGATALYLSDVPVRHPDLGGASVFFYSGAGLACAGLLLAGRCGLFPALLMRRHVSGIEMETGTVRCSGDVDDSPSPQRPRCPGGVRRPNRWRSSLFLFAASVALGRLHAHARGSSNFMRATCTPRSGLPVRAWEMKRICKTASSRWGLGKLLAVEFISLPLFLPSPSLSPASLSFSLLPLFLPLATCLWLYRLRPRQARPATKIAATLDPTRHHTPSVCSQHSFPLSLLRHLTASNA